MHKQLPNLTNNNITKLENLSSSIGYRDKIEHIGVNGYNRLSIYNTSKWYDWTRQQKQEFKSCFEDDFSNKAIIGWFLKFPKTTGFLDEIDYWKTTNAAGIILAYALNDGQDIYLNHNKVVVNKGEGIAFSLRLTHEVKAKPTEQNWACLMTMSMPA
jgi:hypothetical protein